ncbi:MAG: tetratricopeptide repeat protein [bacterium]|jgi:predicted O-linked N-acetylglucosamine transferase (SPINDLY family)|nr:tetratricopeptide repeat protein [Betaproteobacteria bacterium]
MPGALRVWLELGASLEQLQRQAEALACYARAVEEDPGSGEALFELIRLAVAVGDPVAEPAVAALLALEPPNRAALRRAGTLLAAGPLQAAALDCLAAGLAAEGCAEAGAAEQAVFAELLGNAGRLQEGVAHYRLALAQAPDWPEVHNNLGILLRRVDDADGARACFERAVALRADYVAAHYNLGNALAMPGSVERARLHYGQALALQPDHAGALHGLAQLTRDVEERIVLCRRALAADPRQIESLAALVEAQLAACDWSGLDGAIDALRHAVRECPGVPIAPFGFTGLTGSAAEQQQCARNWVRTRVEPRARQASAGQPPFVHRPGPRARLRIGYLSADFRDHVMGRLLVDLFPAHDRKRVEVFGLSVGPDDGSVVRAVLASGCDRFLDLSAAGTAGLAARIHEAGIDVLVDLTGFTEGSRSEALALRPAPVQVNWLGYPGTMGAAFIDAIFCDPVLVPDAHRQWFDETVVHLPCGYQPSPALPAGGPPPAIGAEGRRALGLPPSGTVFASFNASHKLRPGMFERWMRILQWVEGSVLWLGIDGEAARQHLRAAARSLGIDPGRLVFAPIVGYEAHRARLPAADLFLDCHPYSAGATASLCLAAGVPLVTLAGETYVSRMATAILAAAGLHELACDSGDAYEALAVSLGRDRGRLQALRTRVRCAVACAPMFDPRATAHAVEEACLSLWHAFCTSSPHGQRSPHSLPQPGDGRQSLP